MSVRSLHPSLGVNDKELSVELFAGGGGVSAGGKMIGFKFDIAINHSPSALAIHRANFPETIQMINDVFEYHPLLVTRGAGVKHLHLSPDCTYHSRAKGKKKVLNRHTICGDHCSVDHTKLSQETADRIRGLAWVGIGWAATVRPRRITLENVAEFKDWGATMVDKDGDIVPDPKRKGETFNAFVGILTNGIPENHPSFSEIERFLKPFIGRDYDKKHLIKGLGYDVKFEEIIASDYGSPTIRKRLYMRARCDGIPIRDIEHTSGDPHKKGFKKSGLEPWKTSGECIDWSIPTPSIFKSKQQIKEELNIKVVRPLADNTMKRIAKGIKKFVVETDNPYIVKLMHKNPPMSINAPMPTLLTANHHAIVAPFFASYYGETKGANVRGGTLDRPLHTITSGGQRFGLVVPYITGIDNKSSGDKSVWSADRPLTTIVTEKRHAITAAYVINAKGTDPKRMPIGNSLEEPLTTITASDTHGVIMVHIQHQFGQSVGQKIDTPLNAITAIPKMSVIASHCIKMKGDNLGYGCDEPVHTITAGGLSHGLVASHLYKFYGNDIHGQSCDEPLHTIRTKDCFGVLEEKLMTPPISDDDRYTAWWIARMMEEYADEPVPMIGAIPLPRKRFVQTRSGDIIVDIGMRMFTERELFRAQGFPDDFIYDPEYEVIEKGVTKTKKVTKTEAVRMVGNSVPPHVAKAILWEMEESELMFKQEVVA